MPETVTIRDISNIRARLLVILANKAVESPLGVTQIYCADLIFKATSKPLIKDGKKQGCFMI